MYGVRRIGFRRSSYLLRINLGLQQHADNRLKRLSLGTKRKVHVAAGFFCGSVGPRILVLDEPTAGLDPPSTTSPR